MPSKHKVVIFRGFAAISATIVAFGCYPPAPVSAEVEFCKIVAV
jgi:hypothetical protein